MGAASALKRRIGAAQLIVIRRSMGEFLTLKGAKVVTIKQHMKPVKTKK